MVEGAEEFSGRPPAFGVMALRGGALERGAALAGVTVAAARRDPVANIRAAAALLDAYAGEAAIDRSRSEQWSGVIVRYSEIELPEGRAAYGRAVDRAPTFAGARSAPAGAAAAPAACPPPPDSGGAPDYASAIWRASPNFNQRPADSTGAMHIVIIHTCESNYTSCWSWLVNPASQASAHYVVNEDGSEASQLVLERDRAWHIAALYDCTLNRRHDCWLNGVQSNHFTVGVEHAGFASQDSFPASQIEASAALVCDITRDGGIPRDWQHIVAHGQLQPADRTDPGPHWPWIAYVHRVQALCGEVVVDDSATFNDPALASAAASGAWTASDSTPDYYGGGYRWASTRPDATDGAVFAFQLAAGSSRTLDARWTSGANRSSPAPVAAVRTTRMTPSTSRHRVSRVSGFNKNRSDSKKSDMVSGSGRGSEAMSTKRPRNSGRNTRACRQSHSPPRSGMLRSLMMTSNDCARSASNAVTPLTAVATWQPRRVNERAMASRIAALSSTIKTEKFTGPSMRCRLTHLDSRSDVIVVQVSQRRSTFRP